MKLGLSLREQRAILLGGVLAVFVFWLYSVYLVTPLMNEAATLDETVRLAKDRLRALEAVTANETAIRDQHRQVSDTVKSLRSLLPAEEELPSIIELLSDLASQAQVKIQTIFPQRPVVSAKEPSQDLATTGASAEPLVYKDVMIQIDAVGGYHQLGTLLNFIESGNDLLQASLVSGPEMSTGMHNEEGDSQIRGEANLLDQGLDGFVAVLAGGRAEVDQITCMAEDATEAVCGQLVRVAREVRWRERFSEPLQVVLHEDLHDGAADGAAAFERFPDAAAGGHVGAKFHGLKVKRDA